MMKRELAALAVLILLVTACIWNIGRIDTLCDEVSIAICKSKTATEQLNFKNSRKLAKEGLEIWQENQVYTQVFLTKDQADDTAQAFFRLMEALNEEDISSLSPAYDALLYQLDTIQKGEQLSVGSIF